MEDICYKSCEENVCRQTDILIYIHKHMHRHTQINIQSQTHTHITSQGRQTARDQWMVHGPIGPVIIKLSILRYESSTVVVVCTFVLECLKTWVLKSISCFGVNPVLPNIVLHTHWLIRTRQNSRLWQTCSSYPWL